MDAKVTQFTLVVKDQSEALEFYTEKIGFEKKTDFAARRQLVLHQPASEAVFLGAQTGIPSNVVFVAPPIRNEDPGHAAGN